MKRLALAFAIITGLAACGADGEPEDPIQPTVDVGVSVGSSGVHTHTSVGVHNSWLSIRLGL